MIFLRSVTSTNPTNVFFRIFRDHDDDPIGYLSFPKSDEFVDDQEIEQLILDISEKLRAFQKTRFDNKLIQHARNIVVQPNEFS